MTDTTATCPSCRKSVEPKKGPLGPACPRCGGLLPRAPKVKEAAQRLPAVSSEPTEPLVAEAADWLISEYQPHCSPEQLLELQQLRAEWVQAAGIVDAQAEARREHGRRWREFMPDVAAGLGG